MYRVLLFFCLPFMAFYFLNSFKEISIHDTVGQTISFKAEMKIHSNEPSNNYQVTVFVQDFEQTYRCVVNSKDFSKKLKNNNLSFGSHSVSGLKLWKGRKFVGYQVNKVSQEESIQFQTKTCEKLG